MKICKTCGRLDGGPKPCECPPTRCGLCGMPAPLHHVGCGVGAPEAPEPAPSPQPEMPDGWKLNLSPYYNEATRSPRGCEQTVYADADGITTEERTSGYDGYTARVYVPLPVLRALLATQGLHIIDAKQKAVMGAMAEIPLGVLEAIRDQHSCVSPIFHPPCMAELALCYAEWCEGQRENPEW